MLVNYYLQDYVLLCGTHPFRYWSTFNFPFLTRSCSSCPTICLPWRVFSKHPLIICFTKTCMRVGSIPLTHSTASFRSLRCKYSARRDPVLRMTSSLVCVGAGGSSAAEACLAGGPRRASRESARPARPRPAERESYCCSDRAENLWTKNGEKNYLLIVKMCKFPTLFSLLIFFYTKCGGHYQTCISAAISSQRGRLLLLLIWQPGVFIMQDIIWSQHTVKSYFTNSGIIRKLKQIRTNN